MEVSVRTNDDNVYSVLVSDTEMSKTLTDLIAGAPAGGEIPLPDVSGDVLEKVIAWIKMHKDDPITPAAETPVNLTEQDIAFFGELSQEMIFELIFAANYLDIRKLLDMCCRAVANSVLGKTPKEIYALFGVTKELTPEEEAQVRAENPWLEDN